MLNDEKKDDKFLRLGELEVGTQYSKVAYLQGFKSSISVISSGYYVFYLKDAEGYIGIGILNNVKDFLLSGKDMNAMKKKPVLINFLATEHNGSISLTIINIETYTEPDFPYEKFIGSVPNVVASSASVAGLFNKVLGAGHDLDIRYNTTALDGIYEGKCGGYVKLLEMVACDLAGFQNIANLSFKVLIDVLFEVQKAYFLYLYAKTNADLVRNADALEVLTSACREIENEQISPIVQDALLCLFGITENPEQLYAILVVNAIKSKIKALNISSIYSTMIVGAEKVYGDLKLVKY